MHKYGFFRTACAVPKLKLADCQYNLSEIIAMADRAWDQGVEVLLFPELGITGYTCGDLFFSTGASAKCGQSPGQPLSMVGGQENADGGGSAPGY